jgi:hypothetical protein
VRITTIDELAAYLRTEIVRIQAEQAALREAPEGDGVSPSQGMHLEGALAAVQKTLAMVSDDAFADIERRRVADDDRLLGGADALAGQPDGTPGAGPVGVAVEREWPDP